MPRVDGASHNDRQDIFLCRCDRPVLLPATYNPMGRDEGRAFALWSTVMGRVRRLDRDDCLQ
jgi:hypothetical protein